MDGGSLPLAPKSSGRAAVRLRYRAQTRRGPPVFSATPSPGATSASRRAPPDPCAIANIPPPRSGVCSMQYDPPRAIFGYRTRAGCSFIGAADMVKDGRFTFTVQELMEILATLPPDLPVLTTGYETGYENFYHPFVKRLRHESENTYYDGQFQDAEDKDTEAFEAVIIERERRDD